jgi:hypothetical protein
MRFRIIVGGFFLLIAFLTGKYAYNTNADLTGADFLLNLATEIVGIVITVLIIDWLIERKNNAEKALKISWDVLHEIDHAIWVWQGGGREFDVYEMKNLINKIDKEDPLPRFMQNLLLRIGSASSNTLRKSGDIVSRNKKLEKGLNELKKLSEMRDNSDAMPKDSIREILNEGTDLLLQAVNYSISKNELNGQESYVKDSSIEQQEWRHYGK